MIGVIVVVVILISTIMMIGGVIVLAIVGVVNDVFVVLAITVVGAAA